MSKFGPEAGPEDEMFPPDGLWPPNFDYKRDVFPTDLDHRGEDGLRIAMSSGNLPSGDLPETNVDSFLTDLTNEKPNRRYELREKPGRNGWTKVPDSRRAAKYQLERIAIDLGMHARSVRLLTNRPKGR